MDTDTVTLILKNHERVVARIARTSKRDLYVSTISVEEMLQGALAGVNMARSRLAPGVTVPSFFLARLVQQLAAFQLLAYDDDAERLYRALPPATKRVGKMDCRIAVHAILNGLTVVTRNTQDFERIPGLTIEDWSV